jgi:hypothetical protein
VIIMGAEGPEFGCKVLREAEGKDLGKLWIPEETDRHWQEGSMVQENCHWEKLDQGQG